jgi:hypothetical protein
MSRTVRINVAFDAKVDAWTAEAPTTPGLALQHRSLSALIAETQEIASDWFGGDVTIDIVWPTRIAQAVKRFETDRASAELASNRAAETARRVATETLKELSDSDVAAVLGLSRQRIGQIRRGAVNV